MTSEWFRKRIIGDGLTVIDEPHVHPFFRANIYHLVGRDRDLLIDSGMGLSSLAAIIPTVPGKPLLAVATHIHVDHVGSLHEFANRAGPRIEAAGFEAMDDAATFADLFRGLDEPVAVPPSPDWVAASYVIRPAPLTMVLDEGSVIDLGNRSFRVLHLPGHSPGSIGLLDEEDGTLFSGDAIYDDLLVDDLPGCDRIAYRRTMERIAVLPARVIHGGHGESFDAARMRAIARGYIVGNDVQAL